MVGASYRRPGSDTSRQPRGGDPREQHVCLWRLHWQVFLYILDYEGTVEEEDFVCRRVAVSVGHFLSIRRGTSTRDA